MTKILDYKFAGTVARIEAGGSWEEIARDLRVTPKTAWRFAKRWGIRKPPAPIEWTTFSAAGDPIGEDGESERFAREAKADDKFARRLRGRAFGDDPQVPPSEPHLRGGPDPADGLGISSLGGAFIAMMLVLASLPASAHSWYSGLRAPGGNICCGGNDCAPMVPGELRKEGEGYAVRHGGKWYSVKMSAVLSTASPDGRAHLCFWGGEPQCLILPGGD